MFYLRNGFEEVSLQPVLIGKREHWWLVYPRAPGGCAGSVTRAPHAVRCPGLPFCPELHGVPLSCVLCQSRTLPGTFYVVLMRCGLRQSASRP